MPAKRSAAFEGCLTEDDYNWVQWWRVFMTKTKQRIMHFMNHPIITNYDVDKLDIIYIIMLKELSLCTNWTVNIYEKNIVLPVTRPTLILAATLMLLWKTLYSFWLANTLVIASVYCLNYVIYNKTWPGLAADALVMTTRCLDDDPTSTWHHQQWTMTRMKGESEGTSGQSVSKDRAW